MENKMKALQDMGLGKLASSTTVFVRKFRWTLKSETLLATSIADFEINHMAKTIEFKAIEVAIDGKINIHDWLDGDMSKEELIFTTFDGCGVAFYQYKFTGLVLMSDKQNFDYSDSDVSKRELKMSYQDKERLKLAEEDDDDQMLLKAKELRENNVLMDKFENIQSELNELKINFNNAQLVIPAS
jgi:hypothetical protein